VFDLMIGKIVSGSYTDERYMVTAQYVLGTSLTSDQITTADLTAVDTEQVTFTVTNLAELAGHTHTLAEGMTVLFMAVYDAAEDANRHHVMSEGSGGSVNVLNAGTNVVSATPYINLPTNRGTADILEFASSTIGGTNGADLQFKAGGSTNRVGIYWDTSSSKWTIDLWRFT
jgi:hypothetical protein